MMVSNLVLSLVRTWVPIVVGALISWVISFGIVVDTSTRETMIIVMTSLITAVYYTLVRLLERKWPFLGVFIGTPVQPVYVANTPSVAPVASIGEEPPSSPVR